jgi:capsid portal protein
MLTETTTLAELKLHVHGQCLAIRTLDRILQTPEFRDALSIDGITEVLEHINKINVEAVQDWINTVLKKEVGELSIRELRETAKNLLIPYYTSKTKDELIFLIRQEKERLSNAGRSEKASGGMSRQV